MARRVARDARRRQNGLLLLTAHRAKGLEFDHVVVLDGGWDRVNPAEDPDAPRRLYYVAMTRARETLALSRLPGPHPFQDALRGNPSVHWRDHITLPPPTPELARRYHRLTLSGVYLSFAGYKPPRDPTHRAITELAPGDQLKVQPKSDRYRAPTDGTGRPCHESSKLPATCDASRPRSWPSPRGPASVQTRSTSSASRTTHGRSSSPNSSSNLSHPERRSPSDLETILTADHWTRSPSHARPARISSHGKFHDDGIGAPVATPSPEQSAGGARREARCRMKLQPEGPHTILQYSDYYPRNATL